METFWIVTLFHFQPTQGQWVSLESHAVNELGAIGIEEFSLSEAEVDDILGDRSYSGGDLPQDILDEVEETVLGRPINYRFFFNERKSAESFLKFVQTECLCECQLEEQQTQDWNAEWKKHYSPIEVNDKLEIIPSWLNDHKSQSLETIYIYPGMGFGTGSHETTFLCLKLLTEHILKLNIESVLDFGSGSGILGLTVFKFFPTAKVDFFDIDPEANKNCYQNAEINQLQGHSFRLLLPEIRHKLQPKYDLVFANILESILVLERDALINHTKEAGHLILSGLLRHQAPGIIENYRAQGMKLVEHADKGDWSALIFSREIR